MAVDTAAKRYSMLNFGDGGTLVLLPAPDGTVATADKQHLLDCYSGIAFNLTTLISIALRVVRDHTGYLYQATERTDYLLRSTDRSGP